MTTRMDRVTVADGGFDLPIWLPDSGRGPGIVLIQEIFGLDDYLRSVAEDLAALGYVVAVPELYWRVEPKWVSGHDEAGMKSSAAVNGRFDFQLGVSDVLATLDVLRRLPEVTGPTGLLGFCLGGSLAFEAAAKGDPDAAVSFYGSAVPSRIGLLPQITCPIQFHFGALDPYIPMDTVRPIEEAVAGHEGAEIHVQPDAGHAFLNRVAPQFYQPEAAARAWALAADFLGKRLPTT